MKALALLAACLVMACPAGAQVFKWTDSNGKVHYRRFTPQDSKAAQVKVDAVSSYDGPPQMDNWAAIIRSPTGSKPPDAKT
jgi:hypothetical protein